MIPRAARLIINAWRVLATVAILSTIASFVDISSIRIGDYDVTFGRSQEAMIFIVIASIISLIIITFMYYLAITKEIDFSDKLYSKENADINTIEGRHDAELSINEHFDQMADNIYAEKLLKNPALSIVQAKNRLILESMRINKSANVNLLIGISFSMLAAALIFFSFFIFYEESDGSVNRELITKVAPRLFLSIFLQIVGFFFLRLYVSNQNDLRQNKNEITNLDLKLSALSLSSKLTRDQISDLAKSLLTQERNFIIRKGERTVSVENDIKQRDMVDIISDLLLRAGGARERVRKKGDNDG